MLGLFNEKQITTDEEYKNCLEKKNMWYGVLFILGIISEIVCMVAGDKIGSNLPDFMKGFYTGIGGGLIAIAIALYLRNRRVLKSKELLRKSRIKNTDERNLELAGKAMRVSVLVLLIAIYLVMLIGGLWYPIMTQIMAGLVYLFLIVYCGAYWILSKKL